MDFLGGLFIVLFLATILYPNFVFFKGLKETKKNHYKHKLFYFLISIVISCSIVFVIAAMMVYWNLFKVLNLGPYLNGYLSRIIFETIIFCPSILVNIYIAKFYLKRISKTKKEKEIELIGIE